MLVFGRRIMVPIFATSTQANLLIYVGGGGFVLLGAFYFGRLVTFFFPKNPLIRKGKEENDAWCEIKFWFRWCRNEIQDNWDFSDLWLKRNSLYLVFLLLRSHLKRIMMEQWTSLIPGPGFLLWLRFWLLRSSNHWWNRFKFVTFRFVPWSNWILCYNGEDGWNVRLEKQELTATKVTGGVRKRLPIFTVMVLQLLCGCLLLSSERKNQTKVELLIHPIRTMISSLVVLK